MSKTSSKTGLTVWLLTGLFVVGLMSVAFAQADAKKAEEIAKITEEAQKTLNGFTWNLEVTSTAGKKEDRKTTQDTVIFKDNKLNSSGLGEKGFGTSNYTLTVGDDMVPVFETMQRNDAEDTVFWRGELVEGKIRGVISVQEKDKPAVAFGFKGEKVGEAAEIPAEKVEPQPEPVIEPTPPAVEETVEAVVEEVQEAVYTPEGADTVIATDAASEVAPAAEAGTTVVEETVAPVVEEPKPKKQPWWAAKKN